MAPPDIKKMISIKLKPRKDPYSDQFSRIVMVKMMMLTAAVTAISWAKDKVSIVLFTWCYGAISQEHGCLHLFQTKEETKEWIPTLHRTCQAKFLHLKTFKELLQRVTINKILVVSSHSPSESSFVILAPLCKIYCWIYHHCKYQIFIKCHSLLSKRFLTTKCQQCATSED